MNHNRDIALFRDGKLVVLGLNKRSEYFEMKGQDIVPVNYSSDFSDIERDTSALYQVADDLYIHENYQVR